MVWIAIGVVVLGAATAAVVSAWGKRDEGSQDKDLGSISGTWLNERRATDREWESNR